MRVDKELTTFTTRMHKDHLEKVLPIFTEVLLKPRFDQAEFRRLREAAINDVEKRLRQGDDENLGKEALYELMYRGHPYGHLTVGHVSELRSITLEDVKAQAARVFTADRVTVGVSGGYPEGLGADLAKILATLPAKGAEPVSVPARRSKGLRYLIIEKPVASTAISIGLPYGLSRSNPDFVAMSVARSAFGEHRQFNGRLMQRLREQRGLNYGDYAYIEHFVQQGGEASQAQLGRARHQQDFTIWLRPVQNENALFALRAALYELRRTLAEEPFGDREVETTKAFLTGYLLLFNQTDTRKLGYALDDQALGLHRHPGFLDVWQRRVSEVTSHQVNQAWRRWVDPCSLQIVVVTKDAQAFKQALLSGDPSPIHYQRDAEGKTAQKPAEILQQDRQIAAFSFGQPKEDEIEIVKAEQLFE
jgi:zinc protease